MQLKGRYDYNKTNDIVTADLLKLDGLWRHTFGRTWFADYRAIAKWNWANLVAGVLGQHLLTQNEIGVGLNLLATAGRQVRIGVS